MCSALKTALSPREMDSEVEPSRLRAPVAWGTSVIEAKNAVLGYSRPLNSYRLENSCDFYITQCH